jgi:MerR family copper efflux transcriptional regulator
MLRSNAMTIGQLSRHTSVPIKLLRTYDDFGFLCTRDRSESNYRLFGAETLQCVQVVQSLRALGLTLKEIQAFIRHACLPSGEPGKDLLQEDLAQALARIDTQISTLQDRRERILEFQTATAFRASREASPALLQMFTINPRCETDHVSS